MSECAHLKTLNNYLKQERKEANKGDVEIWVQGHFHIILDKMTF